MIYLIISLRQKKTSKKEIDKYFIPIKSFCKLKITINTPAPFFAGLRTILSSGLHVLLREKLQKE